MAWDESSYRLHQLAGALLETDCPNCRMHVHAMVINGPDGNWRELECPACGKTWEEET